MATKHYPLIAREGWGRIALIVIVATGLQFSLGFFAAVPAWLCLLLVIYQHRDPMRIPPSLPLAVVSPIHGTVSATKTGTDPWLQRDAEVVEIKTGLFDIGSIYSPTEGKIIEQWRWPPKGTADNAEKHNDAIAYWLQTDEDDDLVLEIERGEWRGPMSIRNNPGERVGQGRRMGYVNNGCIARIYLPRGSLLEVVSGETVLAAENVLGQYVHLTQMANSSVE